MADRIEMEGERKKRGEGGREVRGEKGRREQLEASGEGHRQAADALQQKLCGETEQDSALEMAVRKDGCSPRASGSEGSCLTVENVTEEKTKEMEERREPVVKRKRKREENA